MDNVTNESFEQDVLKSDIPVLVDFWAPWCGPCRALAPVLAQIAEERGTTLKIVKVNVDENKEIAERMGVGGIPALFLFREGKVVAETKGARPKEAMDQWLDESLALPMDRAVPVDEFSAAAQEKSDKAQKAAEIVFKGSAKAGEWIGRFVQAAQIGGGATLLLAGGSLTAAFLGVAVIADAGYSLVKEFRFGNAVDKMRAAINDKDKRVELDQKLVEAARYPAKSYAQMAFNVASGFAFAASAYTLATMNNPDAGFAAKVVNNLIIAGVGLRTILSFAATGLEAAALKIGRRQAAEQDKQAGKAGEPPPLANI